MSLMFAAPDPKAVPIRFVTAESWPRVQPLLSSNALAFAAASGFSPVPGRHVVLPNENGAIGCVLLALDPPSARGFDPFFPGRLATVLPSGVYAFADPVGDQRLAALGWLLSSYRFARYRRAEPPPRLCAPVGVDAGQLERVAAGVALARDLINTPANEMGPDALEAAVAALAGRYEAGINIVRGNDLLTQNFPLIHAVGRAAKQAPRLVEFVWGQASAPKITLVGKGVTFDTGGLDIKPESAMGLMKKDMGGAAAALGLAYMIMDSALAVRLRVLLPIVENSIAGDSFRPGDIYRSRKGLTVEVGNTDAEGRLILADTLALADEENSDLLVDFATLTGAARVALGPEIPPFYTTDDGLAAEIATHSKMQFDPVWRLPLWDGYDALLDGKFSDLNNISSGPFAGSITAALFLRRFVENTSAWAHFDIYAWNPSTKPGRPEGGEAQASRLLYDMLEKRYRR